MTLDEAKAALDAATRRYEVINAIRTKAYQAYYATQKEHDDATSALLLAQHDYSECAKQLEDTK